MSTVELFPMQNQHTRERAKVRKEVYMAAYEVYAKVYGAQEAMIDPVREYRGGFSVGEIIAFLYARHFPQNEWKQRVNEAFEGMKT